MRLALNRGDTTAALITEDFEIAGSLSTSVEERVNDAISYAERDQTIPGRNSDSDGVTPGEEYIQPTRKQQMIELHFAVEKFTSLNPVRRGTWGDSFEKEWIPYEGPLGGEGWQSTEDQTDVRYTDDPPGEVAEGYEEVAEDWGEDPSQPELDDFGFRGPASSATEDFESVSSHIEPVFEEGEIDGGVVEADIQPQDSERWDSVWDLDGENPKVEHPTSYGNLFADVQMPVGDFKKIQAHIGNNLNTWDGTFFEEVDEQRLQSVTEGLTGEDVDTEFYDGVPVPYIEIGSDGTLKSTQEGRHRVVAAERLGLDEIPVRVIIDPDDPGEGYSEDVIDDLQTDYMDMAEQVEDADNETKVEATTEMENKLQENISSETDISLPGYRIRTPVKVKPTAEVAETIERADEIGITEGLDAVDTLLPVEESIGQYNYDTNTLSLRHNTRPGELESPYKDGYIVGDSYEYTALHELGHHAHSERIDDRSNDVYKKDVPDSILHIPNDEEGGFSYGMDLQDKIENKVSTYAAENTPEFVAEMFAGLCLGIEFNEEMMKYYERVGGPEEWREYRKAAGYDEDPGVGKQDGEDLPEQFAISAQRTLRSFRNWKQD